MSEDVEAHVAALEAAVERLEAQLQVATNRDIPVLKGSIRAMVDEPIDSVDAFPHAGRRFGEKVTQIEDRMNELEDRVARFGDLGNEPSSKEEKYAAVLRFAANKQTTNGKATVSPSEIKGCTGVSRRYAYDLVDAMAEDIEGVRVREAQEVETGSGVQRKAKALLVDCAVVQVSSGGVNKFTTAERGGGVGEQLTAFVTCCVRRYRSSV